MGPLAQSLSINQLRQSRGLPGLMHFETSLVSLDPQTDQARWEREEHPPP